MADPSDPTRRLTFLERRVNATPERFSCHWSTDHADIARWLPVMSVDEQNHAARQLLPGAARDASFTVDALRSKAGVLDVVTELHFGSAGAAHHAADAVEARLGEHAPESLVDAVLTPEVRIL